jgi:polar amino acid transport system substrate-binding protein
MRSNTLKIRFAAIFIIISTIFTVSGFSQTIMIGRVNYKMGPLYFQENGEWVGTNVEGYKALMEEAGIEYKLEVIPWSRAMYMEANGDPIIVGQLTQTEARKKNMHFIGPHSKEEMVLSIHKAYKNMTVKSLDDIVKICKKSGLKVKYQKDVFISEAFHKRIEEDKEFRSHFEESVDISTSGKMVTHGRIVGLIDSKGSIVFRKNTQKDYKDVYMTLYVLSANDVYFGVSNKLPAYLIKKLDDANKRVTAKGIYNKIMKKWNTINTK